MELEPWTHLDYSNPSTAFKGVFGCLLLAASFQWSRPKFAASLRSSNGRAIGPPMPTCCEPGIAIKEVVVLIQWLPERVG